MQPGERTGEKPQASELVTSLATQRFVSLYDPRPRQRTFLPLRADETGGTTISEHFAASATWPTDEIRVKADRPAGRSEPSIEHPVALFPDDLTRFSHSGPGGLVGCGKQVGANENVFFREAADFF